MKQFTSTLLLFLAVLGISTNGLSQDLYGPEEAPPKGSYITSSANPSSGQVGFAGGITYSITNVMLANSTTVYFTMLEDEIKLSMDGAAFSPGETLQYNAAASNLDGGIVIWQGSTYIPIWTGSSYLNTYLDTRFIMTVTLAGGTALSLIDPVSEGLSAQCGGLAHITSQGITTNVKFEMLVSDDRGLTWIPHLVYYNNAHTPPNAVGAYSSFNFGFYWYNDPPELDVNNIGYVDEGDSMRITYAKLAATDVESSNEELVFIFDPLGLGEQPAFGSVTINGNTLSAGDSISMDQLMNDTILYIHDGSESLEDSIALMLSDSDSALYKFDGDSIFYYNIQITPVDDPPTLQANETGFIQEDSILLIDEDMLNTVDPESDASHVIYRMDPSSNSDFPLHGLLKINGIPLGDGDTFTQADINSGLLKYDHDGSPSLTDGFLFTVEDEYGHLASNGSTNEFFFTINIEQVNDNPVLTKLLALEINEGERALITSSVLAASDEESETSEILFTIDPDQTILDPIYGKVLLNETELGDGDSFSMKDIIDGLVSYAHDGSESSSDFIPITITDSDGGIVSDGGFTVFHFNIIITNVNDPPMRASAIEDQTTRALEAFEFTIPEGTFTDEDIEDELSLSASLTGEVDLPSWLTFDAGEARFSGTPQEVDMGTYSIVVIAKDLALEEARDTFDLEVTEAVHIDPLLAGNISVGPNPFIDFIKIQMNGQENDLEEIKLYNILGAAIKIDVEKHGSLYYLDVPELKAGVYFLRARSGSEYISWKVIKRE